ncbi:lysoplasmalogenase family protein [Chloroflexota bacterium]
MLIISINTCQLFRSISTGWERSNNTKMKVPFLFCSLTISLMVFSACLTLLNEDWITGPALLVSDGAVFFFLSDTLLAWNRIATSLPNAKLQVRLIYHSGQPLNVM